VDFLTHTHEHKKKRRIISRTKNKRETGIAPVTNRKKKREEEYTINEII